MSLRILHALRTVKTPEHASVMDVLTLSAAQQDFGHVVEIVTLEGPGDGLEALGIPVHRPGTSHGKYGYNAEFVTWIRAHARNYDCVLVHGIWGYNAYGVWLALREAQTPYFVFPHGNLDPWFKLHRPINHFIRWCYWPWAGYPVLRDAHAVFFLSDNERNRAQEAFWLYDCHEFVVRTGIDAPSPIRALTLGEAFSAAHPALDGKRCFAALGDQLLTTKPLFLAQALRSLMAKGLWDPKSMRLVVAHPERAKALLSAAERLGLADSIYYPGPLDLDGTWGLLVRSECLLRPSRHETASKSIARSLAVGTPVLVSVGVDAWKDLVNAEAGIAGDETAEGIAKMLGRWLLMSEDEKAKMRWAARRCYEARYTLEGAANTLTAAIYLLIGVHRDSRWDSRPLKPASELL